jgi:Integrase core domain
VTPCPTAEWTAQRIIECCAWDRWPPPFLIHDRDSRYGAIFERRLRHLGIEQVRTPFRAPRANAISERWVKSVCAECLDHLFIFNEAGLRRVIASYVSYFNHWRPHRSLGQRAPCDSAVLPSRATSSRRIASRLLGVRHNGRYFYALQPFDRRKPAVRRFYLCDTFSLTGKSTLTARLSRFESAAEPAGQRSRHSHDHRSVAVVDSVDQRPVERTVHASFLTESPMIAITRILVATPAACVALLVRVVPAVP